MPAASSDANYLPVQHKEVATYKFICLLCCCMQSSAFLQPLCFGRINPPAQHNTKITALSLSLSICATSPPNDMIYRAEHTVPSSAHRSYNNNYWYFYSAIGRAAKLTIRSNGLQFVSRAIEFNPRGCLIDDALSPSLSIPLDRRRRRPVNRQAGLHCKVRGDARAPGQTCRWARAEPSALVSAQRAIRRPAQAEDRPKLAGRASPTC